MVQIQNTNKVNAVFAMAVTKTESTCGTNGNLALQANNWCSVGTRPNNAVWTSSNNGRSWSKYSSYKEATLDFGDLVQNSSNYFKAGRYTVRDIGPIYCEGNDWANSVVGYMKDIYEAAGVDITTQSSSGNGGQIYNIAKEMKKQLHDEGFHYNYSNIAQTFEESRRGNKNLVCATFVSWVLQKAGAIDSHTDSSSGLAGILEGKSDWKKVYETTTGDISKLQKGDVIWYNVAGHSEIYAGNKKSFNVGIQSHIDSTGGPTGASFTMGGNYKSFKVYRYKNDSTNSTNSSGTGRISNGKYSAVVSGRKYTIYNQMDQSKAWYSTDGCLHCSVAMCISGFGETYTPNQLPGFSRGSGCWFRPGELPSMLTKCKLSGLVTSVSSNNVKKELKKGSAIYAHVTGGTLKVEKGSKSYGGHWVAIVDYKISGGKEKIYLLDPNNGVATGWGDLNTNCRAFTEYRVLSKK